MSETLALTRLAISSSRKLVIILLATIVTFALVGLVLEFSLVADGPVEIRRAYVALLVFWGLLPAAFASLVLFDFSSGGNLGLPESNCSAWILRTPIASWKIAIVPIALKTMWISILWICFAWLLNHSLEGPVPYVVPCFAIASSVMWLMAIAWRPFRFPWLRMVLLALAGFLSYCILLLLFAAPGMPAKEWRGTAVLASEALSIASFLLAVFTAVRAIETARTAPDGIISEKGKVSTSNSLRDQPTTLRRFSSPTYAFAWYELAKTRDRWMRTMIAGVLPIVVIVTLFIPFNVLTLVMILVALMACATVAVSGNSFINETNTYKLSEFLVRSPLSTATLAWTRFAVANLLMVSVFSCIALVFLGWSLWPENRATWMQWATDQAAWLGADDQAFSIGMRLSAMILLVIAIIGFGVNAGYWWTGATGRDSIMLVVIAISVITILSTLMALALWFSKQTDMPAVKESLRQARGWIAPLAITLLSAKLVASIWISVELSRAKLAPWTSILKVCVAWALIALPLAWTLAKINPIIDIKPLHCVAFVLLCIPLARVLVLPIAMFHNRHR